MDRRTFNNKMIYAALAALAMSAPQLSMADGAKSTDVSGKCYGVVGAHEGECGGKNPANGESWGCAGQNPTADLGWKLMKKSECDKTPQHKDATTKKFVPNKA